MSLFEEYKKYKAGKTSFFLSRRTEKLFKLEFTDKQLLELSEWDHKNDINIAIIVLFVFFLGLMYGAT